MDAVIYSSLGRYLAPVSLILGEGLVDMMTEEGKKRPTTHTWDEKTKNMSAFRGVKMLKEKMDSESYLDQLWNLSSSNTLCWLMSGLEVAAVLPVMGWFLSAVRWRQSRERVWFSSECLWLPRFSVFSDIFLLSAEIELELVLMLCRWLLIASGALLTVFVRSPKRLFEWPVCRRGGWDYPAPNSLPSWYHTSDKQSVSGQRLHHLRPLKTARVGGWVGGKSSRSFFFFFHQPEFPSGFPAALAVQHVFRFSEKYICSSVTDAMRAAPLGSLVPVWKLQRISSFKRDQTEKLRSDLWKRWKELAANWEINSWTCKHRRDSWALGVTHTSGEKCFSIVYKAPFVTHKSPQTSLRCCRFLSPHFSLFTGHLLTMDVGRHYVDVGPFSGIQKRSHDYGNIEQFLRVVEDVLLVVFKRQPS